MSEVTILTSLKKAIKLLERSVAAIPKDEYTRDASILRFKYSFELCCRSLKQVLAVTTGTTETDLAKLFAEAAEHGLIGEPERWVDYLQARNLVPHAYNEKRASELYETAEKFIEDARKLSVELEERLNSGATL